MNLFDALVEVALKHQKSLGPLRVVVEKELLHHDVLRVLSGAGLLTQLTFMGGTCLRACYGSHRLSEDLDFTGGASFTREQLADMGQLLVSSLKAKYGLEISVSDPVREVGNVATWKIRIQTRPGRKDLPAQRINMDVCAVPSYERRPMLLLNPYGVEMGTSGLILQAQSREEIFVDKLLAFALRPNRLKNRDLWDMAWLHQQRVVPALAWLDNKLKDHAASTDVFLRAFEERAASLNDPAVMAQFRQEMRRFLPNSTVKETVESDQFWLYLCQLMDNYLQQLKHILTGSAQPPVFKM